MKDRIRQVMESQHQTQKVFASFVGINEGSLSSIFTGRTKPTLNIVEAIKSKIPSISTDWLIFGRGSMFESDNTASPTPATGDDREPQPTVSGTTSPTGELNLFSSAPVAPQPSKDKEKRVEQIVKYIDKPQRSITEIRIFYDDQTWETFVPKK